jgi:hypothetical protein
VALTSTSTTGNQWYRDGNQIAGATNASYAANSTGNYTVRKIENNCSSPASNAIAVTSNPTPPQPTITQNGNTLESSAPSGNQWYKNGLLLQGATANTYTPNSAGAYTVKVTQNGCSSAMSTVHAYVVTGINSPELDNAIRTGPNPVRSSLNIVYNGSPARFTVRLVSSTGAILLHCKRTQRRTDPANDLKTIIHLYPDITHNAKY